MARVRLRTKLVLSLILTTAVLTGGSLLGVQSYLREHARAELNADVAAAFQSFEEYAELRLRLLRQAAAMAADQPRLKALMPANDAFTIQDSSSEFWDLTESDLFLLADPRGRVMALHPEGAVEREAAQIAFSETIGQGRFRDWWLLNEGLYEVFLEPIYNGDPEDGRIWGFLVAGFAVDHQLATDVSRVTSEDQVAFRYGRRVVASSLTTEQEQDLAAREVPSDETPPSGEKTLSLGGEAFLGASVALAPAGKESVTLTLLKSYDAATLFLNNVNRLLLAIGLVALAVGSVTMFLISRTLTHPLEKLASGVAALEEGDFSYPLNVRSHDEVGELTKAFDSMRRSLKQHQEDLLHAERLVTIGRMASTISHDLRHPLTTILAYAELLSEHSLDEDQRRDLYRQIRLSVNNMADLIASLLEFSKAQEALKLAWGDCVDTIEDAIRTVRLRPEFSRIDLALRHEGPTEGWFDFVKLDRAFRNLLSNACEAAGPDGSVRVVVTGSDSRIAIAISDDGPGIPEDIREDVFQPFVTSGKADGTGLGLAVVEKIVRDHGGEVRVSSTGSGGTTFALTLPLTSAARPVIT